MLYRCTECGLEFNEPRKVTENMDGENYATYYVCPNCEGVFEEFKGKCCSNCEKYLIGDCEQIDMKGIDPDESCCIYWVWSEKA